MNKPNKQQLQGALGAIIFHIIVLVILLLVTIQIPPQQQEDGLPVVMGNVLQASTGGYEFTEVDVLPKPVVTPPAPAQPKVEEQMITQDDEPSIELPDTPENKVEQPKQKTPQEEAAERAAQEAERQRLEAERIAREASERIANAFSKGGKNNSRGDEQETNEGAADSTQSTQTTGVAEGMGGYGTFDLNGRSLGDGGLPRPVYNVQDEGRVVVNITVNPEGRVIKTSINSRTNTVNPSLRKAALEAAKKAVFNAVDGVNNQMGTITYYFKLR